MTVPVHWAEMANVRQTRRRACFRPNAAAAPLHATDGQRTRKNARSAKCEKNSSAPAEPPPVCMPVQKQSGPSAFPQARFAGESQILRKTPFESAQLGGYIPHLVLSTICLSFLAPAADQKQGYIRSITQVRINFQPPFQSSLSMRARFGPHHESADAAMESPASRFSSLRVSSMPEAAWRLFRTSHIVFS